MSNDFLSSVRSALPMFVGFATTAIFYTVGETWLYAPLNFSLSVVLFVSLFVVMVWCAFNVVHHSEVIAGRLGEPYGTLILTLAVISIEVAIMATVMLGGEPNPTLPRDTIMAVLMIVLNGMVGVSILAGAIRFNQQEYNLQGAVAYLGVITTLAVIALVVPTFTVSTADTSMTPLQAVVFGLLTMVLYGAFLLIQTVRHHGFFKLPDNSPKAGADHVHADSHVVSSYSTLFHVALLLLILLPIVLLSKPLAKIIDHWIEVGGAPTALGGILIAMLVLAPEALASFQSALRNDLQRSVNLSLGSGLSTIGLTIPVMLTISLATGTPLELGLEPVGIILLSVTLFIAHMTFSGAPTNILLGLIHLVLFAAFLVLVFNS
jgi:Ca2+:H+ antiporter